MKLPPSGHEPLRRLPDSDADHPKAGPSAAAIAWANEGKGPLENYPDSAGFYTEREYERRGRTWAAIGYDAGAAAKAQESAAEIERLQRALAVAPVKLDDPDWYLEEVTRARAAIAPKPPGPPDPPRPKNWPKMFA